MATKGPPDCASIDAELSTDGHQRQAIAVELDGLTLLLVVKTPGALHAVAFEMPGDGVTADAELFSQVNEACTGLIALDQLIEIVRIQPASSLVGRHDFVAASSGRSAQSCDN